MSLAQYTLPEGVTTTEDNIFGHNVVHLYRNGEYVGNFPAIKWRMWITGNDTFETLTEKYSDGAKATVFLTLFPEEHKANQEKAAATRLENAQSAVAQWVREYDSELLAVLPSDMRSELWELLREWNRASVAVLDISGN